MKIVILGLTITSVWGNGHATTYRSLIRELTRRGLDVLFLEWDKPWYASNRDLPIPDFCRFALYDDMDVLQRYFEAEIAQADCVMIGSYVPEGIAIGEWITEIAEGITIFYDIDTPITAFNLAIDACFYLTPSLASKYDLYLSFSGGPFLVDFARRYNISSIYPLYCSIDPELYFPEEQDTIWDLGYLGTYSEDRHWQLEEFLIKPAQQCPKKSFVVAGSAYPETIVWNSNIKRIENVSQDKHREFYNSQRFTLNITRAEMIQAGYSPSVRLFEAAACGIPIISDYWDGIDAFFEPEKEILIVEKFQDVLEILETLGEAERRMIGQRARARVLSEHTSAHRAKKLINLIVSKQKVDFSLPHLTNKEVF